ncbi:MAG: GTPase [Coprobacillus cateniformis]
MANRKATVTGNKPGVTKAQQIIRVAKDFELFDTPGVLWPKFEDEHIARNIALLGSIKQDILPLDDLFVYVMTYLTKYYPDLLKERYGLEIDLDDSDWLLKAFDHIAQKRKIKLLRGETDYDRVIQLVFSEIYDGSIGKVTWEDYTCVKD